MEGGGGGACHNYCHMPKSFELDFVWLLLSKMRETEDYIEDRYGRMIEIYLLIYSMGTPFVAVVNIWTMLL